MGCQRPPSEGFCWATNRMRSVLPHRRMLPRHRALPHRPCSGCLTDLLAEPQLPFSIPIQNASLMFGPVELWATRWRRPSAAANPQGFCWPATPPVTHFVARVMLIGLIDCPSMKIGREQSSLGLVVAQLSCLWLALASLALFEPIAVAVHFEDVDVVGQPVEERTGQPLGSEHAGPLVEWQIAGDNGGTALVPLAEDLEQQLGAGRRQGYIAEFIDDQ